MNDLRTRVAAEVAKAVVGLNDLIDGILMAVISGGLLAIAIIQQPGGYSFAEIPQVFTRVIGHYFR